LRPAIAGRQAARLAPDHLAEAVGIDEFLRGDAGLRELVAEAELGQFPHRVGLQVDADTTRAHIRRGLEHRAVDAGRMQRERRGQPADAAADDERLHGPVPSAARCAAFGRGSAASRRG